MSNDRTGGSRRKARVKPPVVSFSEQFSPKSPPPDPFDQGSLGAHAVARGFQDGDTIPAEDILSKIGYQHASAYFDLFKLPDGSIESDASMRVLHQCVVFDRKLQSLMMEYIGLFELQFRAQYSYFMSNERGAFAHRNPKNFKDGKNFEAFLHRYGAEFNRQLRKGNPDIRRAFDDYGDAPVWLAVEIMSFGTLSMLFKNTKSKAVRKGVAASFGATPEEFESWIYALSAVRNTCAHFGRLCGTKLTARPKMVPGLGHLDNGTVFYAILVLQHLLSKRTVYVEDTSTAYDMAMLRDFAQLFTDFSHVTERCGIPKDWVAHLFSRECTGMGSLVADNILNVNKIGRVWFSVHTGDGVATIE